MTIEDLDVKGGNTVGDLGEFEVIRTLSSLLHMNRDVTTGPGDDCAVVSLDSADDLLLTSDPLVLNIHFTADAPGRAAGRKALARTLSDIAAMGGSPAWSIVNIAAPPDTDMTWLTDLYRGMSELADETGVSIAGGDTAEAKELQIHVFTVGKIKKGTAVLRSGARPDDRIFVTGPLGGSIFGRHLLFTPRLAEGQSLCGIASSMIDISDGIATDLPRILKAGRVGAVLNVDRIPIHPDTKGHNDMIPPVEHALSDGEDFELLFTVPAEKIDSMLQAWPENAPPPSEIGVITDSPETLHFIDSADNKLSFSLSGYEHLRDRERSSE